MPPVKLGLEILMEQSTKDTKVREYEHNIIKLYTILLGLEIECTTKTEQAWDTLASDSLQEH